MDTAAATFQQYKLNIYGPAYSTITKLKSKIELNSQANNPQAGYVSSTIISFSLKGVQFMYIISFTFSLSSPPDNSTMIVYDPSGNEIEPIESTDPTELAESSTNPISYNMPSYGGIYNVQFKSFASHELSDGLRYSPLYSLSGGYEETWDS